MCYLIENKGDNTMTNNEFEAWVDAMEEDVERFCRVCGFDHEEWEVDICDGCFDSEQVRM